MNIFEPLTTYLLPTRSARVLSAATSEPPLGSVIASAMSFSPASTAGAMRRFISSEPIARIGGSPMPCVISEAVSPPAPGRASSSDWASEWKMSKPLLCPPYSSG